MDLVHIWDPDRKEGLSKNLRIKELTNLQTLISLKMAPYLQPHLVSDGKNQAEWWKAV